MYGCTLEPIEAVTVTEVHVVSIPSGRTDYVVAGESVQLSCHYILRPDERVIAVNWAKDGSEVRRYITLLLSLSFATIFHYFISGIFFDTESSSNCIVPVSWSC